MPLFSQDFLTESGNLHLPGKVPTVKTLEWRGKGNAIICYNFLSCNLHLLRKYQFYGGLKHFAAVVNLVP